MLEGFLSELFKNNIVPLDYEVAMLIMDLRGYNTAANREYLWNMLNNGDIVETTSEGYKLYKGPLTKSGYARISDRKLPDHPEGPAKSINLHRLVYECLVKTAPLNGCICHRSNIRHNINPDDLFEGTFADNSSCVIIANRGNIKRGENHHRAKLTDANVAEIVHLRYTNKLRVSDIAEIFHITSSYCSRIIHSHSRSDIASRAITAELSLRR